jgi:hypothetical protein
MEDEDTRIRRMEADVERINRIGELDRLERNRLKRSLHRERLYPAPEPPWEQFPIGLTLSGGQGGVGRDTVHTYRAFEGGSYRRVAIQGLVIWGGEHATVRSFKIGILEVFSGPIPAKFFEIGLSFEELKSIETSDGILRGYQKITVPIVEVGNLATVEVQGRIENIAMWGSAERRSY